MKSYPIKAIAVFNTGGIKGTVVFIEDPLNDLVQINVNITGLNKNAKHGFHVHEAGDLSEGCDSMCAHFNPFGLSHGCPGMSIRHVGDLGNLITDSEGTASYTFVDNVIKLRGISNIIGRGLVIHADPDDCGKGLGAKRAESLKTGNSGKRIACAVIGYSKN
jgi:Cu-Zn family superoxide dismutase